MTTIQTGSRNRIPKMRATGSGLAAEVRNGNGGFNKFFDTVSDFVNSSVGYARKDTGLPQLQNELSRVEDSARPDAVPERAGRLIRSYLERGAITEETAERLLAQYGLV